MARVVAQVVVVVVDADLTGNEVHPLRQAVWEAGLVLTIVRGHGIISFSIDWTQQNQVGRLSIIYWVKFRTEWIRREMKFSEEVGYTATGRKSKDQNGREEICAANTKLDIGKEGEINK